MWMSDVDLCRDNYTWRNFSSRWTVSGSDTATDVFCYSNRLCKPALCRIYAIELILDVQIQSSQVKILALIKCCFLFAAAPGSPQLPGFIRRGTLSLDGFHVKRRKFGRFVILQTSPLVLTQLSTYQSFIMFRIYRPPAIQNRPYTRRVVDLDNVAVTQVL